MKYIRETSIICFLLLSYGAFAQQKLNGDSLELLKEFTAKTEAWVSAYNSKDAKNLLPFYSEDATYISGHVPGLELDGRQHVIDNFQRGINGGGHLDKIEILSMNVSCDMATLICKYRATNSGVTVEGRNLLVMKRLSGKWLIVIHMTVV